MDHVVVDESTPPNVVDLDMVEADFEVEVDQPSTQNEGRHSQPPLKRVRVLTSSVWKLFSILPKKPNEEEKAKCNHVLNLLLLVGLLI